MNFFNQAFGSKQARIADRSFGLTLIAKHCRIRYDAAVTINSEAGCQRQDKKRHSRTHQDF
jgi:hypothetical protein